MWFSVNAMSGQDENTRSISSAQPATSCSSRVAKCLDLQVRPQPLDLPIGQPAALDARGGADALDGGHASQGRQAVGSQRAQSAPGAFELVDPCDDDKDLGSDLKGIGVQHNPDYTHSHPIQRHHSDAQLRPIVSARPE